MPQLPSLERWALLPFRGFSTLRAVLMGTKSCTYLNFFDKIFVRKSCRRRLRNALYGEKILLMGKCFVWAWFRQTCICSSMRGRYKIQSAEGWNGNVLFANKRVIFARADTAVALQYNYQWSTDTNACTFFTLGVIVGRWTQAQLGKRAQLGKNAIL